MQINVWLFYQVTMLTLFRRVQKPTKYLKIVEDAFSYISLKRITERYCYKITVNTL